jgi:hypothetical protein
MYIYGRTEEQNESADAAKGRIEEIVDRWQILIGVWKLN